MQKVEIFKKSEKNLVTSKMEKNHLAVLLGYETIIWHKQISNLGFSPIPMRAHCVVAYLNLG